LEVDRSIIQAEVKKSTMIMAIVKMAYQELLNYGTNRFQGLYAVWQHRRGVEPKLIRLYLINVSCREPRGASSHAKFAKKARGWIAVLHLT